MRVSKLSRALGALLSIDVATTIDSSLTMVMVRPRVSVEELISEGHRRHCCQEFVHKSKLFRKDGHPLRTCELSTKTMLPLLLQLGKFAQFETATAMHGSCPCKSRKVDACSQCDGVASAQGDDMVKVVAWYDNEWCVPATPPVLSNRQGARLLNLDARQLICSRHLSVRWAPCRQ